MQIGRMRNLVEVWKYIEVQDSYGQPKRTYEKLGDVWAEIRPLLGRETFYEKMEVTDQTHKILMRYFPLQLDATMQLRYEGRVFEVIGQPANVLERNIQWQFNVRELFDEVNYGH